MLDIGCGNGNMLRQFLQWGAKPENLAGIELRSEPVEYALTLNPNLDIRCGSADSLPWANNAFDMVSQHTVFTSILDYGVKKRVASEMLRVLKPHGIILWYDFWINPTNQQTHGIRPSEIRDLFPGCNYKFCKITLAPPLARKVVPFSWVLAFFLEELRIFNSHYLVTISPKS
jgi:SAM-dependent methyltransferase